MSVDLTIAAQLKAAVAARKGSLTSLRSRIWDLCEDLPVGVVLRDDSGEAGRIVRVESSAHQGPGWYTVRNYGVALMWGGAYVAGSSLDLWDGNNWQYAFGPVRLRDQEQELPYLSGAKTRELAARLPAALARYMAECEAERAANDATLCPHDGEEDCGRCADCGADLPGCNV